ncbi:MAG: DNA repair protein RecO [Patescibacteria group bacterium]
MLYHTYNTEAFVLSGMPVGESSRFIFLFTKDLGLVGARAQNARSVSSKLRHSLNDLSLSKVSLVRGKNAWRLTNATFQKNFFKMFRDRSEILLLSARVLATIKTLVAGEEANPALYETLSTAFAFLENENLTSEEIKNVEAILMLRILDNLGYFGSHTELGAFVADPSHWSRELLAEMQNERSRAILAINNSLKASHL